MPSANPVNTVMPGKKVVPPSMEYSIGLDDVAVMVMVPSLPRQVSSVATIDTNAISQQSPRNVRVNYNLGCEDA